MRAKGRIMYVQNYNNSTLTVHFIYLPTKLGVLGKITNINMLSAHKRYLPLLVFAPCMISGIQVM